MGGEDGVLPPAGAATSLPSSCRGGSVNGSSVPCAVSASGLPHCSITTRAPSRLVQRVALAPLLRVHLRDGGQHGFPEDRLGVFGLRGDGGADDGHGLPPALGVLGAWCSATRAGQDA
jgi:hypothetical protein